MSSPFDTTIIFVPGAWHGPEAFFDVGDRLRTNGYNIDYVNLASVGPTTHLKDFQPDVAVIREHITKAVSAGQQVVMVVHSYGGVPTSDAVHGLDYSSRQAAGQPGGVTHMFFCCSFLIPVGQSLQGAFGGNDLPWYNVSDDKTEINPMTPEKIFYNDMPQDMVRKWVAKLRPHSYQTLHSKVEHAMWRTVPSTYLYCLQDNAIPIAVQELMVKEWAGGAGVTIRTETVDAAHSPFFTKPDEMAVAIVKAAELKI